MANPALCPKCGRKVDATAFICPGCEYILDTSFLGDDITDDDRERRALVKPAAGKQSAEFGEDAIILGDSGGEWSDFSSRDAGGMTREVTQARFYIGGSTAVLLHEDAVPEIVPGVVPTTLKMTPFEQHVLQYMNGKRSMGRIQKKSGMEDAEFKASVAMLADKGVIRLRTTKKKKKGRDGLSRSESSRGIAVALDGDRTMVAPTPLDPSDSRRRSIAGAAALPSRAPSTPSEVTALKNLEPKKSRLAGPASVRLLDDEQIDDGGKVEAFGEGAGHENASNVFARASVPPVSRSAIIAASAKAAPAGASAVAPPSPSARAEPTRALEERTPSLPSADVEAVSLLPPGADEGFAKELGEAEGFEVGTDQSALARRHTEPEPEAEVSDRLFDDEVSNPTAMGDLRPVSPRAGAAEDDLGDEEAPDDERAAADDDDDEAQAEARDRDESRAGGTRPVIHDERTANLPPLSDAPTGPAPARAGAEDEDEGEDEDDDEDEDREQDDQQAEAGDQGIGGEPVAEGEDAEGFEVELRTAALEASVHGQPTAPPAAPAIPELPSDALQPLPSSVHRAPSPPPPPPYVPPTSYAASPAVPPPPLPGQVLAKPTAPTRPGLVAAAASAPARPAPGTPGRPPTIGGGGLAPRPSQQSKVPFEQARKAEKIYEQAIKDHGEGRLSSARMNVKLAVMYDPTVPAYQEFLAELDRAGAGAKPLNTGKSRELLLFEQASECEGRGSYDDAIRLLEEAIEIAPRAAALRNRIGVVLSVRLKRHDEALAQLKVAIELEPGNIVFMNNYSKVTAMLDSELEKAPEKNKGKGDRGEKIAIKKMRPKMF
ncbi:MAG: tetratricopeptide repeat protein [Deltaproteobacteria bacterium]|nr:tetratricopeptide repeat protein [Deltaproteobacteria bacterium]